MLTKVLIVEDVALIRMATADMLESLSYAVAEAGEASAALEILQSDPEIAVLLTDVGLPGLDGVELAKQAKAMRPNLRIVIASGYSVGLSEIEGAAFLPKPYSVEDLRRVLEPL